MKSSIHLLCVCAANLIGCGLDEKAREYDHASRALVHRSPLEHIEDDGDLRVEARQILDYLSIGLPPPPVSFKKFSYSSTPSLIKVWRRSYGGDSCTGRVDIMPLEDYVKGVLPHEWITSWNKEALKAGAVAIRTYAAYWIAAGGKYKCADLCDTAASQIYKDTTYPVTDGVIDATRGEVLLTNGKLTFTEYSAENGDPTRSGVADAVCAGKTVNGHGRGMCQWGSQRWAQQGKDYKWIAWHYYPQTTLWAPSSEVDPPDGGTSFDADAKTRSDIHLDSTRDFIFSSKDGKLLNDRPTLVDIISSANDYGAHQPSLIEDGGTPAPLNITDPSSLPNYPPNNTLNNGCVMGGQLGDYAVNRLFIFFIVVLGIRLKLFKIT